jgi:hypothetical protein
MFSKFFYVSWVAKTCIRKALFRWVVSKGTFLFT